MNFPKATKEELVERVRDEVKSQGGTLLSKVLTAKIFDIVFEVVVSFIEEGKEVTMPALGVLGHKTVPTTKRRDIGRNSFITVEGYYRPKLRLNDALRRRCIDRKYTFNEPQIKTIS